MQRVSLSLEESPIRVLYINSNRADSSFTTRTLRGLSTLYSRTFPNLRKTLSFYCKVGLLPVESIVKTWMKPSIPLASVLPISGFYLLFWRPAANHQT